MIELIGLTGVSGVTVGLLAAGFAVGRVRTVRAGAVAQGANAARGRTRSRIAIAIVAFPVATLMLAKLFNNDVLGWVFGLSLFAIAALAPCVAVFCVGLIFGSRRATAIPPKQEAAANLVVQVDRGTVHASDDALSKRISMAPGTTVRAMVATAIADAYLPSIAGGRATWVVESSGAGHFADTRISSGVTLRPIAVCAQQWTEVAFLIDADVSVATHFGEALPVLNLRYHCQVEPKTVVAELRAEKG